MKLTAAQKRKTIREFARRGLSLNQLTRITGFPKSTVYYHARHALKKMSRVDLSVLTPQEKGYLFGLFVGDGSLYFRRRYFSYRISFDFNARKEDGIARRCADILRRAGARPYFVRQKGVLRVSCMSKTLYDFFARGVDYRLERHGGRYLLKKDSFRLGEVTPKFVFSFIGGLLDSDGCVTTDRGRPRALISTVKTKLAEQIMVVLKSVGVRAFLQYNKAKGLYTIRLSTQDYLRHREDFGSLKGR